MKARNTEVAVIFARGGGTYERFQDVYYLSNFYSLQSGQSACSFREKEDGTPVISAAGYGIIVARLGHEPILITDESDNKVGLYSTDHVRGDLDIIGELIATLRELKIQGEVAFVGSDFVGTKFYLRLCESLPQIQWRFDDEIVKDIRNIKSPRELEAMREAGRIVSRAMNECLEALFMGKPENVAAGLAAKVVYEAGGQLNFIFIHHGPSTAEVLSPKPISGFSEKAPAIGDLVRVWIYGPIFQGYWLDPGRTAVIGHKPTTEQRNLVETCANIVGELIRMIKPGVTVYEVFAKGKALRKAFGGEDDTMSKMWNHFGHGNGLYWDPPIFGDQYKGPHHTFKPGMVGGVENFLSTPGIGAAGFEQNFIVTSDGTELLVDTPMLFWD